MIEVKFQLICASISFHHQMCINTNNNNKNKNTNSKSTIYPPNFDAKYTKLRTIQIHFHHHHKFQLHIYIKVIVMSNNTHC